jgi:hypothetical protein
MEKPLGQCKLTKEARDGKEGSIERKKEGRREGKKEERKGPSY